MVVSALRRVLRSLSARRAWIEISARAIIECNGGSLSARRAWIEMEKDIVTFKKGAKSLSARRAWIEITEI